MSINLFALLFGNLIGTVALRLAQDPTQTIAAAALGSLACVLIGRALIHYLQVSDPQEVDR